MEKNDKAIRMQWLIGLALLLAYGCGHFLYRIQFIPQHPLLPYFRSIVIVFWLIGMFGFSFLFYRCAYKKPGTKLLSLILFINGLSLILNPILYLTGAPYPAYITHRYGYLLFSTTLGTIWFILCWRMRRLNQKIRREQLKT